jgi:WD40 repeat protein
LLAFNSKQSRIVVVGGNFKDGNFVSYQIRIIDSDTGKTVSEIPLENSAAQLFTNVSDDGTRAVVPVGPGAKGALAVYDLTTGQELFPLSALNRAEWIGPTGTILSLEHGGSFSLCDGTSGKPFLRLEPDPFSSITLSRTGKYLATVSHDGEVCVRDGHTGQLLKRFEDRIGWEKPFSEGAGTSDVSFALDDTELIIANGRSHLVRIWDWRETTSTKTTLPKRSDAITEGFFVSDGSLLFAASDDGYAGH